MKPVIPPHGFRHAVDLLLKNGARTLPLDTDRLAQDLVALGDDMRASPEFAPWVIAEYERVLHRPAPAVLAQLGQSVPSRPALRDLFLIYVPEDRLPIAAPLAVELVKRRISVAFSEYEIDSEAQLGSALARGADENCAGAVLVTPAFLRRHLSVPTINPRLKILGHATNSQALADALAVWVSGIRTHFKDIGG